jgi:hypothetical protein
MKRFLVGLVAFPFAAACSSTTTTTNPGTSSDAGGASDVVVATGDASDAGSTGTCTAAIEQTLRPVDKVSQRPVTVLSDVNGTKTLFIDASAGGPALAASNPYIYVNLERAQRVDVTDKSARTSTDWDLALKRHVIFTNGGDGGPGQGGAASVSKPFDQVTAGDAPSLSPESFFDQDCNAKTDQIGALATTFSDWYDYDTGTNQLTPKATTYVIKGGTGKTFKVSIQTYYGTADGGTGQAGALYLMKVAAL